MNIITCSEITKAKKLSYTFFYIKKKNNKKRLIYGIYTSLRHSFFTNEIKNFCLKLANTWENTREGNYKIYENPDLWRSWIYVNPDSIYSPCSFKFLFIAHRTWLMHGPANSHQITHSIHDHKFTFNIIP